MNTNISETKVSNSTYSLFKISVNHFELDAVDPINDKQFSKREIDVIACY